MRKIVFPLAGAVTLMLAACLTAPGEPSSSSNSALTCAANERAFNGACRKTCATSADCGAPNSCMVVAAGSSLCLDYSTCAYLGSDTECSGVPYGGYGEYSSDGYQSVTSGGEYEPYWVPTYDPYATGYGNYGGYGTGYVTYGGEGYSSSEPFGCGGNATWHTAPPPASADPKCGETHAVARCKKVGNVCRLVSGNTIDVAER